MSGVSESNIIRVNYDDQDHRDEIVVDYLPCDDDHGVVMMENERRLCTRNSSRNNNAAARTPRVPIVAPPSPPPRVINQLTMRFLFEKQLQNSDVSAAGRIVIPKKVAEMHLPSLESKEGTWLHVDDMDLFQVWSLKFRYWPNNKSRMYVLENTKDFVSTYGLAVEDYIMVYKDDDNGSYAVRAKKLSRAPRVSVNEYYGNYYSMEMEATAPNYGQDQLPAGDMGMTSSSMNLGLLSHQFPSSDEFHDDEYVNVVSISPFANHH